MRLKVYKAKDGWRWRVMSFNNRIMAESGEPYTRRRDAYKAALQVRDTTWATYGAMS